LEDVWVSQGPPFMGSSKTIDHTHTHEDSRSRESYEDTFICVPGLVDIHTKVDLTIHLGHMMMKETYSGIHGDALDCKEETHFRLTDFRVDTIQNQETKFLPTGSPTLQSSTKGKLIAKR
jgi:hypothetical protein